MSLLKTASLLKHRSAFSCYRVLCGIYPRKICSQTTGNYSKKSSLSIQPNVKTGKSKLPYLFLFSASLFAKKEDNEEKNPGIIKVNSALKSIKEGDYGFADKQLHAALKIARDNRDTDLRDYISSILGELSYMLHEYDKAELIYVDLLQRVLAGGYDYMSIPVMNISLKLSVIYGKTNQHEKALAGFTFCAENLKKKLEEDSTELNAMVLYGMTQEYYAYYLMRGELYDEATERLEIAHDLCVKVKGPKDPQVALLLNSLGTVAIYEKSYTKADDYFSRAIKLSRELQLDSMYTYIVNQGRLKLKLGLREEAMDCCSFVLDTSIKVGDAELQSQAELLLKEIKEFESTT